MLFKLAETLGQSVEWVMNNISVQEVKGWAKYFEYNAQLAKRKH